MIAFQSKQSGIQTFSTPPSIVPDKASSLVKCWNVVTLSWKHSRQTKTCLCWALPTVGFQLLLCSVMCYGLLTERRCSESSSLLSGYVSKSCVRFRVAVKTVFWCLYILHLCTVYQNLLEKPSSTVSEQYATQMIHFKSVPVLNVLVKQTKDDTDLQDDIEFLHDKLNTSLQDLRWGGGDN
jgi:hypothetical protein